MAAAIPVVASSAKGQRRSHPPTIWGVANVDLDDGSTTLNANLTINADSVEPEGDGVDNTITISDATQLAVNLSGGAHWTLDPRESSITTATP